MKASRVLLDLLQEEEASLRESSFHMTRRGDEDTEGRGGGAGSENNRDLKHQDGRLRRGRHIRVKAEARPASRFTRLSMLRWMVPVFRTREVW